MEHTNDNEGENIGELAQHSTISRAEFWPALENLLDQAGPDWKGIADRIAAFGPNKTGPNLLVNRASELTGSCVFRFPLDS